MTGETTAKWEERRTDESCMVEDKLREAGFHQVDAFRYNSASIRVRIIDDCFESIPRDERDSFGEPVLGKLPLSIQSDIVTLVLLAPSELEQPGNTYRECMLNTEFENPSPTML